MLQVRTIPALVRDAVEAQPDRVWLRSGDGTLTFAQAWERTAAAAERLADLGVGRGAMVMTTPVNVADDVLTWFALMSLGAVMVAVNPASTEAELGGLLAQTLPRLVVTHPPARETVERAAAACASAPRCIDTAALFADLSRRREPDPAVTDSDPAVLIPTSGTTGRSKLVTQTHRGYVMAGEGFPFWMGLTGDDRLMTALPLFHINAPAYSVLGSLSAGAGLVLLQRFSPRRFLDEARRHGATEFNAIGAMLEMLMRQPERHDDADTPLRLCYTGPSPSRERQLEMERRFGLTIVCGYGMSESTYGFIWPHGSRPYGTLGTPRQHPTLGTVNQARVMEEGREVAVGEVGELEMRNPTLMLGYHGMPEETAQVLVDGWLRTGDLVRRNADGTVTFVSRRKEVIRRRGENLAPAEVEAVLEEHPDILEAAVVGVPSDLTDEEVKAFVVPRPGQAVQAEALWAWCEERLARFKVPRYLEVLDALPRTPTGRLAKHLLPRGHGAAEHDRERGSGRPPLPAPTGDGR